MDWMISAVCGVKEPKMCATNANLKLPNSKTWSTANRWTKWFPIVKLTLIFSLVKSVSKDTISTMSLKGVLWFLLLLIAWNWELLTSLTRTFMTKMIILKKSGTSTLVINVKSTSIDVNIPLTKNIMLMVISTPSHLIYSIASIGWTTILKIAPKQKLTELKTYPISAMGVVPVTFLS